MTAYFFAGSFKKQVLEDVGSFHDLLLFKCHMTDVG